MAPISAVAALVVAASWIYWIGALLCSRRFFCERRADSPAAWGATPPVSILKPVKGLDFEGWENFVSHCEQDYPRYEVLFGVADLEDPATPLIHRLQKRYGRERIRLIAAAQAGPNPKAALLDELARRARHDVLVATDSDVRVPPDFLRRVVPRLADPAVGMVTLPYRGERILTAAAALEALGIETAFLPSVLVGRRLLRADFALGAANALRRDALDRIGGFRAVADYLADDYQLGLRIGEAGLRVELGDVVVATVLGETTLRDWWLRETRWARAIRSSRRAHYPGLLFTFSTPLALLFALTSPPGAWCWVPLGASMGLRWWVARRVTGWTGHRALRRRLWLLPVCDLLAAAIWLAGFAGRTVRWRGRTFRVGADGRLCDRTASAGRRAPQGPVRRAGLLLERTMRRRHRIFEFTDDPRCLMRLAVTRSARAVLLADGTRIRPGDRIAEIHLWNERLPAPRGLPSLSWGLSFHRRMLLSLRLLAEYLDRRGEMADIRAVTAETSLSRRYPAHRVQAVVRRWGFQALVRTDPGPLGRLALLGQNLYVHLLRYAFHGTVPGRDSLRLQRVQLWISRGALAGRYLPRDPGSPGVAAGAPAISAEG